MLVVHVHIKIKPECVEQFIAASLENASNSIKEPGITRFDLVQSQDDPHQFVWRKFTATPMPRPLTRPLLIMPNGAML